MNIDLVQTVWQHEDRLQQEVYGYRPTPTLADTPRVLPHRDSTYYMPPLSSETQAFRPIEPNWSSKSIDPRLREITLSEANANVANLRFFGSSLEFWMNIKFDDVSPSRNLVLKTGCPVDGYCQGRVRGRRRRGAARCVQIDSEAIAPAGIQLRPSGLNGWPAQFGVGSPKHLSVD
jgi:hypothetical protein